MNQQIIDIWRCLDEHNVRYLTIGGFAVNIYGYNRNTGDIDLYIDDTKENRINLRKALAAAGIGDFEEIETIKFLPGWSSFSLKYGLQLDIMTSVKGLEEITFDELLHLATIVLVSEIPVKFIDYSHLIIAKKASNRSKDSLDVEELEKVNKKK